MNTADLIMKRFGVFTRARQNPLITELTDSVRTILANNPNRVAWTICNLSDTRCFIALDRNISDEHGILLSPNGGVATMTMDEDFEAVTWEVFGISDLADKDLYTLSVEIVGPLGKGE